MFDIVMLIGGAVLGSVITLFVQRVLRESPAPSISPESDRPGASQVRPQTPRAREFEGDPFPGPVRTTSPPEDSGVVRTETWTAASRRSNDRPSGPTYRAARGNSMRPGDQWNPFAEDQSLASRIKAARHRPGKPSKNLDYYSLLGLERSATDAQIERAYRRYAAQIHPDRFFDNPVRRKEAEAKLKQLNAAMQVLRDPLRRARYDASLP